MRIIAGTYGGRVWHPPKGLPVRPTTDRTREALFNLLQSRLHMRGADVLDLFSGTGGISLECMSRGAASVVAVDRHRGCVKALQTALKTLGAPPVVKTVQRDVRKYVKEVNTAFDFIFLDPPYDMPAQADLVETLIKRGSLKPEGILVLEHRSSTDYAHLEGFVEVRKYGDSSLSFFTKKSEDGPIQ
ncbi:MAG: 16S rRNA (guanine(966)-N(2))-methyltransferase RsmD [Bacteroidia bacterium]